MFICLFSHPIHVQLVGILRSRPPSTQNDPSGQLRSYPDVRGLSRLSPVIRLTRVHPPITRSDRSWRFTDPPWLGPDQLEAIPDRHRRPGSLCTITIAAMFAITITTTITTAIAITTVPIAMRSIAAVLVVAWYLFTIALSRRMFAKLWLARRDPEERHRSKNAKFAVYWRSQVIAPIGPGLCKA